MMQPPNSFVPGPPGGPTAGPVPSFAAPPPTPQSQQPPFPLQRSASTPAVPLESAGPPKHNPFAGVPKPPPGTPAGARSIRRPSQTFAVPHLFAGDENIFNKQRLGTPSLPRTRTYSGGMYTAPTSYAPTGASPYAASTISSAGLPMNFGGTIGPGGFPSGFAVANGMVSMPIRRNMRRNTVTNLMTLAEFNGGLDMVSEAGDGFAESAGQQGMGGLLSSTAPQPNPFAAGGAGAGAVPAGGLPLTVLYQLTAEIERLKAELAQRDAALSSWQQLLKPDGTTYSFLEACKDGRCQLIEFFLQHNADVKQTDKGCTGLMLAAQGNQTQACALLLQRGAEVDGLGHQPDPVYATGETALMFASCAGAIDTMMLLISRGANVNLESATHMTALIAAASCGQDAAIDVLLANGAVLNYYNPRSEVGTALYAACMQGHPSSAAKLLKAGAAMLAQIPPDFPLPAFPMSELCIVAKQGPAEARELIQLLLQHGAQIDMPVGPLRRSALMWAAEHNRTNCVEALLEFGANPNVIDGEGNSPLLLACRHGHHQVALLLLMHGARVDFATENGDCPLNVALASRSTPSAMVTMLVQFGADPNCSASRAVSNNPAPVMRFASEEHKVAAEQGVVYRKTISRVLMDMLSEWTVELPPVEVVQLIREYIPGSELPNRFFIQE